MAPKRNSTKKPPTGGHKLLPAAASQETRPAWPALYGLFLASDLSLSERLPDQILTISNLWTGKLCKSYVAFLSSLPLTTTPGVPKKGDAVRVNDRYQVDDPAFAESLWSGTALKTLIMSPVINGEEFSQEETRRLWGGEVVGLNPNIRVYRYTAGQFFDQHYDESNLLDFPPPASADDASGTPTPPAAIPAKTTWTLLLYLTSPATGCAGGETVFYPERASKRDPQPEPIVAELEVGMALLHRHGKECLLHEGREVTSGEKWVVRSDLCVKR